MPNNHRQKYISRLLIGLALFNVGTLIVFYMFFFKPSQEQLLLFGAAALILLNVGLLGVGSAIVHKVKSDLIRKQKQKDQHKKYEFE